MKNTKIRKQLIEAISLGWCHQNTAHFLFEPELVEAIVDEVEVVLPKLLGQLGGQKTAQRGAEYYKAIRAKRTDYPKQYKKGKP